MRSRSLLHCSTSLSARWSKGGAPGAKTAPLHYPPFRGGVGGAVEHPENRGGAKSEWSTPSDALLGAAEYQAAIDELRRLYLADRLPGETAAAWLRRTGLARGWFGEAEPLPTDPDSTGRAPAKGSRHGE